MRVGSIGSVRNNSMGQNKKASSANPSFGIDVRIVPKDVMYHDKKSYDRHVVDFLVNAPEKYKNIGDDNTLLLLEYKNDPFREKYIELGMTFMSKDAKMAREKYMKKRAPLYAKLTKENPGARCFAEMFGVFSNFPHFVASFKNPQVIKGATTEITQNYTCPGLQMVIDADETIREFVEIYEKQELYNHSPTFRCFNSKKETEWPKEYFAKYPV